MAKSFYPAWLALLALSLIWGASFLSIRIALDEISFLAVVAHRVFWAALLLWIIALIRGYKIPTSLKIWVALLVMGALNNIIPFTLMAWGQRYIETGLMSIFNATTAFFGIIVAALVFRDEKLTIRRGLGVLLGFIGVCIAIGFDNLFDINLRSLAQWAVVLGGFSYALAGVWARLFLGELPTNVAAAGMLTGSSIIIVPLAWWLEGPFHISLQGETLLSIGYFSIIATAIAYLFYYHILARSGSGNLMLVTLMIAPVAILLGAVMRNEQLNYNAYSGLALLVFGLIVLDGRAEIWLSRLFVTRCGR